jgi:arginine deiminase
MNQRDETMNAKQLGVWSEAGKLRRVMVCAPGLAHQRLTPENCNELLFDDVIWLQQARRDHFDFVAKMVDRDVEVFELHDLLTEVVAIPAARDWILDRKVTDDLVGPGFSHEIRTWLSELPADRLAEFLVGGVAYQDVPDDIGGSFCRRSASWTRRALFFGHYPIRSSCVTTVRGSSPGSR